MYKHQKIDDSGFLPEEHAMAKAIYESMYPDSRWEHLHPRRTVRIQRLFDARAALRALEKFRDKA